jgi:acyl carrier protein
MDVIDKVITDFLFAETFLDGHENLQGDDNLFEKGLIDSIRLFQLIAFLEERFGIVVLDGDVVAENFQSIHAIRDLIQRQS